MCSHGIVLSRQRQVWDNQGHPMFMYIFGIVFSVFRQVRCWNSNDLEYVIEQGGILYKETGSNNVLSCAELPQSILVENTVVAFIEIFSVLWSNCISDLNNNLSCNVSHIEKIYICQKYCFSILLSGQYLYIVDSHSRDSNGDPHSNGCAVILKFSNIHVLASYIKHVFITYIWMKLQNTLSYTVMLKQ